MMGFFVESKIQIIFHEKNRFHFIESVISNQAISTFFFNDSYNYVPPKCMFTITNGTKIEEWK